MEKKHLNFYIRSLRTGVMPKDGLCHCAKDIHINVRLLELCSPDNALSWVYWASEDPICGDNRMYGFNPLRQNIVLFMAAMNGEL